MKKEEKVIIIISIIIALFAIISIIIYYLFTKEKPTLSFQNESSEYFDNYVSELYESVKNYDNAKISYELIKNNKYNSYIFKITISNNYSFDNYIVLVVDLENESLIEKEKIASLFGYTVNDIELQIRNQLRKYYKLELEQGYIKSECDFECYLYEYREIEEIDDIYYLSIENEKLVAYINLTKTGNVSDLKFFNKDSNKILIS